MKYIVNYQDHDNGAIDGKMVRDNKNIAEKSIRILKECGYRVVYLVPKY